MSRSPPRGRGKRDDKRASRESDEHSEGSVDGYRNGCFVRPRPMSEEARQRVRSITGTSELRYERRNGYVRPTPHLPCGNACCIADLGECGDRKCGNYRLGDYSDVRPSFLEWCVEHIRRFLPQSVLEKGLVYCSLGSGQLLFDWEILERLIVVEGIRVLAVHLIDKDYGGSSKRDSAVRAQQTFAGWFADQEQMQIRSFLSALDFERWVKRSQETAHILLDCDAVGARKRIDVDMFRCTALRPGGLCLVLSNPAKRTSLRLDQDAKLQKLALHYYRRGVWRQRKDISASRSRSRRRRRRDADIGKKEKKERRRRRDEQTDDEEIGPMPCVNGEVGIVQEDGVDDCSETQRRLEPETSRGRSQGRKGRRRR